MSVSLSKGQGVSLKKNEYDLSSVTIETSAQAAIRASSSPVTT